MTKNNKEGFFLFERTNEKVVQRCRDIFIDNSHISYIVGRDLERLYGLYQKALSEVDLSYLEACLICDIYSCSLTDPYCFNILYANVEDGIKFDDLEGERTLDSWEVSLLEKIKKMNDAQQMAVIDAAERFWSTPREERNNNEEMMIKKIFMIKD